ncbi:MAG: NAD(P)-dependent oxidoreductase [Oscillospiraceae bacterium]|jgi:predicted homoserine dehydrogenase-like protein|nr:NAD(P)-dependent oxidoreductase [Oscillospiraceae bacterium]
MPVYEMSAKLARLESEGTPIGAALIGAGQMGKDIAAQFGEMVGTRLWVIVDLDMETARAAFRYDRSNPEIVETNDPAEAELAVKAGKRVASTDYRMAVQLSRVQSVIDATGSPEMGARVTMECIFHKKHIVMMNVECDITIGPILRGLCEQAGIVYSLTAGDEPGAIVEVWRFAKSMGFEVVAAGKGKNNPLDIYANPGQEEWSSKARARNMNPRMLVEFVDGSKTMIEMAAVANATGLVPDVRGMHGPRCLVKDLTRVFSLESQGGVLTRQGVVDYAIGDVHPGVFVIVTTDNQRVIDGLVQRDMGNGPNYLLYRPYHLCSIETPLTAAQAVLYGESTAHPMRGLTAECVTVAKRDLHAGETLDGIGEYCYRASIDLHSAAKAGNMLPVGLAKGAKLLADAPKDSVITYDMVQLPDASALLNLRRLQDLLFG